MNTPVDPDEVAAAQVVVRKYVDEKTNYGQHCRDIAAAVVEAVEAYRGGREI